MSPWPAWTKPMDEDKCLGVGGQMGVKVDVECEGRQRVRERTETSRNTPVRGYKAMNSTSQTPE